MIYKTITIYTNSFAQKRGIESLNYLKLTVGHTAQHSAMYCPVKGSYALEYLNMSLLPRLATLTVNLK